MAELDPRRPQAVDAELQADLVRLLRIRGPMGILNVADIIVPVVSLGNVVNPTVEIQQPSFRSTDIFSAGRVTAPPALTRLADTGPLPSGTYDVIFTSSVTETVSQGLAYRHRNAADTADLMLLDFNISPDRVSFGFDNLVFAYELAINERLVIENIATGGVGTVYTGSIFARLR